MNEFDGVVFIPTIRHASEWRC